MVNELPSMVRVPRAPKELGMARVLEVANDSCGYSTMRPTKYRWPRRVRRREGQVRVSQRPLGGPRASVSAATQQRVVPILTRFAIRIISRNLDSARRARLPTPRECGMSASGRALRSAVLDRAGLS